MGDIQAWYEQARADWAARYPEAAAELEKLEDERQSRELDDWHQSLALAGGFDRDGEEHDRPPDPF